LEPVINKKGDKIMKTKIFTLFILVAFTCLPLKALAYERNFAAGSIIIPMDSFYQPDADGGVLEAYGLAYYLLDHQDPQCLTDAPTDPVVIACQDTCADGDTACELACVETFQDECEHTIAITWIINDQKTAVDGVDLVIDVTAETLTAMGIDAVVKEYDHAGGTASGPTPTHSYAAGGTYNLAEDPDDSVRRITYRGSLFIIDVQDLEDGVEAQVYDIIDGSSWAAVNVHVAQVPFAAPVFRDMRGTPPKIALMNSDEDKTTGNAAILESYLRLAGICSDSYEIVTPNEIAGLSSDLANPHSINPILGPNGPGYDFLWAPHWDVAKGYDGTGGLAHQDDVILEIQNYLKSGSGMLAECASIEAFEHNTNGQFLTDMGFAHNGVDIKAATNVIYNDVAVANAQIGNPVGGFAPEGGHLHNWRPLRPVDLAADDYNFDDHAAQLTILDGVDSVYNSTVKRFTTDSNGTPDTVDDDWDYFVGGYAYGNNDFGYVVYLGGHSYAKCDATVTEADVVAEPVVAEPNFSTVKFEFSENLSNNEILKLKFRYTVGNSPQSTMVVAQVDLASDWTTIKEGLDLEIDFSNAKTKDKKLEKVEFRNLTGEALTVDHIELDWESSSNNLKIKKIEDQDNRYLDAATDKILQHTPDFEFRIAKDPSVEAPPSVTPPSPAVETGCTNNSGCEFKNLAGVRYVLNTLFNIKYQVTSHEYVRSAPIVAHPWLYQGTFEHPSYFGHFRRFNVEDEDPAADWDTALGNRVLPASTGNAAGRKVYTGAYDDITDDWSKINFDAANVVALTAGLDVEDNADTADEIKVIERLRGRDWDYDISEYVEQDHNKLGGIMHSAPVVIRAGNSRVGSRSEVAYVGDLYGMLHAIETATGLEKWAYIPSNLLEKLQNDRTDPNAEANFAAVDASPTAKDIYYDHDADPSTDDEWRTILICAQGFGGNSIFALDVTDPENFDVLWEVTDTAAPGGGMGYTFRAALDKIRVPVLDNNDEPIPGQYEIKWMVYAATSFAHIAEEHGGINVFAFDLMTGTKEWTFTSTYADSVNDIPGAVTTFDLDGDTFADRIYVGDMNGRMWEIGLTDDPNGQWEAGESVHTAEVTVEDVTSTVPIPLFYAGIGNPISVSPAIININGHVLLVFGTGGTDWASNDQGYHAFAVDATAAGSLIEFDKQANYVSLGGATGAQWTMALAVGEKVWSSPTISNGQIWLVTSFGSMESADPKNDRSGSSKLRLINLDTGSTILEESIKKVRGSIYVTRKHVYMTGFEGEIIQFGDDDFSSGTGNRVVLKSWQQQ